MANRDRDRSVTQGLTGPTRPRGLCHAAVLAWVMLSASLLTGCPETVVVAIDPPAPTATGRFDIIGGATDANALPQDVGPQQTAPIRQPGGCQTDVQCLGVFGTLAPCTRSVCNVSTGACELVPDFDGAPCDDGDSCTTYDGCSAGVCDGMPLSCDDGNLCTIDVCSPATGACSHTATSGICDDGNLCTLNDSCEAGVCSGDVNPICTCTSDASCGQFDDGDQCNGILECMGGYCVLTPGSQVMCDPQAAGPCGVSRCDPVSGGCVVDPLPNGTTCNDGNACTSFDQCSNGVCTGQGLSCDDFNICTMDGCDPSIGCVFTPSDGPCDDGDLCTQGDTCTQGLCQGVDNPSCQCNSDAECALFDDGNPCNGTLTCQNQVCLVDPDTVVSCSNQAAVAGACQDVICDPASGQCVTQASLNGTPCNDGSVCTTTDYCMQGVCKGIDLECDDNNPCTQDSCSDDSGCTFLPVTGLACDDQNACTINDLCLTGQCKGTNNPSCQCFSDGDCALYEDGNFCNGTLRCVDNVCLVNPDTVIDCEAAGIAACVQGTCQPETGICMTTPIPAGTPCDDSNSCTKNDTCTGGWCLGTPLVCDDGDVCTVDSCNPAIGCVHQYGITSCNDNNPCTNFDVCVLGSCIGVNQGACSCSNTNDCAQHEDGNKCNGTLVCKSGKCEIDPATVVNCPGSSDSVCGASTCNPSTGKCSSASASSTNNKPCDDGNACTSNDRCQFGQCVGQVTMNCNDNNDCTKDLCQPGVGCSNPPDDNASCSDGDTCTQGDYCDQGQCIPGVASSTSCAAGCQPKKVLNCGGTDSWGTGLFGATDLVSSYSCSGSTYEGKEYTYSFTAPYPGEFTVNLTNETGLTDVMVLAKSGQGCDPNSCMSTGYATTSVPMNAGQGFYIVVDSQADTDSNFNIQVTCSTDAETNCANGQDDDGDGQVDCADSDCASSSSCSGSSPSGSGACEAAWFLTCGANDQGSSYGNGSTSTLSSYSGCNVGNAYTGKEFVYSFFANASGPVTVSLNNATANLNLFVLQATGGACDGSACIKTGFDQVTFNAVANTNYFIVVDGYTGAQGTYNITLDCGGGTETSCTNNVDDDSDGKTDCQDPDCAGFPACSQQGESNCSDLIDNDGDGKSDCQDSDCAGTPACTSSTETSCINNVDDDSDGKIDCVDSDCQGSPACTSGGSEQCDNNADDDGDGLIDCEDGDCFNHAPQCQPACQVTENAYQQLTCPVDEDSWTNDGSGSTDVITRYSCNPWTYDGPEYVYAYKAAQTGGVTVTVTEPGNTLDIMLLKDMGLGCNPASCLQWDLESLTWQAQAGVTYYIVVEGYQGGTSNFDLTFQCTI